jgi:hypothetical protein
VIEIQIEIPDDVYQAICSMAAEKGVSLEDAVAALVRLGVAGPGPSTTLEQTLAVEDQI